MRGLTGARRRIAVLAALGSACGAVAAPTDAASQTVQSRRALPVMDVRVGSAIRDEPKVRAHVRVRTFNAAAGRRRTTYSGWAGIEIRGATSKRWPKKSFALELRSASGGERRSPLLGMPADDDWVLYASYGDPSLIRNQVGYAIARWTGQWAPRTRFVELRLNGAYHGLYVLTERAELSRRRALGAGRGGADMYLVELTSTRQVGRDPHFLGPVTGTPFKLEDPKRRDVSAGDARRVQDHVAAVERALHLGDGDWRSLLDEARAVDYVLLQELFRNADAFRASTFLIKPASEPLRLGPVWDLDFALGNRPLGASQPATGSWLSGRPWASALVADPAFRAAMATRWRALRDRGILAAAHASIDRSLRVLADGAAVARDAARWPRPWSAPPDRATHAAEVAYLRSWLSARVAWMDSMLPGPS